MFAGVWLPLFAATLGAALFFRWHLRAAALTAWSAGAALSALGLCLPSVARATYLAMSYAAYPVGWAVSHALLGAMFYLVMTPIGLLMRLFGYDPMHRRFDPAATSYWHLRPPARDAESYFRQY